MRAVHSLYFLYADFPDKQKTPVFSTHATTEQDEKHFAMHSKRNWALHQQQKTDMNVEYAQKQSH